MPTKYTKEILEDAAKHNTSIYGVLRYIGVGTNSGGMHHYISGRIKKFGIDTSHFLGVRSNCGKNHKGGPTKRTADEILVLKFSGPKEKRKKLYSALLEIGREEKCERCGLDNKWNGESLTLQIDHKNGNNLDNIHYGFNNLKCFSKAIMSLGENLTLSIEKEFPIRLEMKLDEGNSYLKYFIAPKME